MKSIFHKIGRPTHLLTLHDVNDNHYTRTACGSKWWSGKNDGQGNDLGAWDARDVNCLNCGRTKAYKTMMGKT